MNETTTPDQGNTIAPVQLEVHVEVLHDGKPMSRFDMVSGEHLFLHGMLEAYLSKHLGQLPAAATMRNKIAQHTAEQTKMLEYTSQLEARVRELEQQGLEPTPDPQG